MAPLTKMAIAGALSLGMMANAASAQQQSLRDVGYVTEGLIAVGIAYEISEVCNSISARTLRGLGYLNQLSNHAKDLGFSSGQIDAYRKDKAEKERLESVARQRLVTMGATPGNAASHCAVGRAEIAKESTIGYLLRG
ncbi:hypothetical protein FHS72_001786 [Loktanella ponticola]|uniref:DUF5333 domain-containing protein n=1 Tax=Yoonia ponticola TaxID=1524255 RepID=A0A7W9BKU1_9RHOB|nr:DUF5333 domain-containing protein [Yoonia ponticola]MBB5722162.1 hypothetical protein [Yoonia ponticola]